MTISRRGLLRRALRPPSIMVDLSSVFTAPDKADLAKGRAEGKPRKRRHFAMVTDWNTKAGPDGARRRRTIERYRTASMAMDQAKAASARRAASAARLAGMLARGERVPGGGPVYEARINAARLKVKVEVRGVRRIYRGVGLVARLILDMQGREVGRDAFLHDAVRVSR